MRGRFWYRLLCQAGRAALLQYERPQAILSANRRRLDHWGGAVAFSRPHACVRGFC